MARLCWGLDQELAGRWSLVSTCHKLLVLVMRGVSAVAMLLNSAPMAGQPNSSCCYSLLLINVNFSLVCLFGGILGCEHVSTLDLPLPQAASPHWELPPAPPTSFVPMRRSPAPHCCIPLACCITCYPHRPHVPATTDSSDPMAWHQPLPATVVGDGRIDADLCNIQ